MSNALPRPDAERQPDDQAPPAERRRPPGGLLWVCVIVAAAAVLVRTAVLWECWHDLPLSRTTTVANDAQTYDRWAQRIADGDLLSRHRGAFYYTPLYAYMLAGVYAVCGSGNVEAGVALNGLLGVAAAVCAAGIAWRFFGRSAALAAGLLMAANGSQIAMETSLLVDAAIAAAWMGGLWAFVELSHRDRADGKSRPALWVVPGALMGVAVVGRASNLLPTVALCGLLCAGASRRRSWRPVVHAAVLGLAVCVVAAPFVLRNGLLHGRWTLTTSGPILLYIGNRPGASGSYEYTPQVAALRERAQSDDVWWAELRKEIAADPAGFARVLARKTLLFFNSWDAPDNDNYYFLRRYLMTMRWLTVGPLVLYVLGFLGVVLTVPQWRRLACLHIFGLTFAASLIAVFVVGRYKLPFLGLLAVFGGAGVARALDWCRRRKPAPLALCVVLCAAFTAAFWPRSPLPLPRRDLRFRPNEFQNHTAVLYSEGRLDEAAVILEDAVELFPREPVFYGRLARIALQQRDPERALDWTSRAFEQGLLSRPLLERHARACLQLGRTQEARQTAERMLALDPDDEFAASVLRVTERPAAR